MLPALDRSVVVSSLLLTSVFVFADAPPKNRIGEAPPRPTLDAAIGSLHSIWSRESRGERIDANERLACRDALLVAAAAEPEHPRAVIVVVHAASLSRDAGDYETMAMLCERALADPRCDERLSCRLNAARILALSWATLRDVRRAEGAWSAFTAEIDRLAAMKKLPGADNANNPYRLFRALAPLRQAEILNIALLKRYPIGSDRTLSEDDCRMSERATRYSLAFAEATHGDDFARVLIAQRGFRATAYGLAAVSAAFRRDEAAVLEYARLAGAAQARGDGDPTESTAGVLLAAGRVLFTSRAVVCIGETGGNECLPYHEFLLKGEGFVGPEDPRRTPYQLELAAIEFGWKRFARYVERVSPLIDSLDERVRAFWGERLGRQARAVHLYHLVRALTALGRWEEADDALQRLAAEFPASHLLAEAREIIEQHRQK